MSENNQQQATFHLGLTMAGAVSAGCYTGGVMDYLFEILDLWEKAKEDTVPEIDPNLVPAHNVVIEARGGASAGGMATIMSALYALSGEIKPVKEVPKNPMDHYNVLYNSWVHLSDDGDKRTFEKIWGLSDLEGDDAQVVSLFNTDPIDQIAEKAFDFPAELKLKEQVAKMPKFLAKDLEVLLSHTMLRGIPLEVDFSVDKEESKAEVPRHTSYEHYLVSHFNLNNGDPVDPNKYLWLNPFEDKTRKQMVLSTIATGAFPIGLKFRKFDNSQFNNEYIKTAVSRMLEGDFGVENPAAKNKIDWSNLPDNFSSVTIDGGTINNEPYREVASILKHRVIHKKGEKAIKDKYQHYALVMIDPFPDKARDAGNYEDPEDLIGIAPKIIGTLWDQAKVKRTEAMEQFLENDYFRGQIFPKKNFYGADGKKIGEDPNPIASASFQAFGGFLDIQFRVHDFFLGRDNARNFVRYFFSLPYDPDNGIVHPIHANWTQQSVDRFKVYREGQVYLPIIPDLNIVLKDLDSPASEYRDYAVPEKPTYDPEQLFELKKTMSLRFRRMMIVLRQGIKNKTKEKVPHPITTGWMKKRGRRGIWTTIKSFFLFLRLAMVYLFHKRTIAKNAALSTIKMVLKDLEEKELLQKMDKD